MDDASDAILARAIRVGRQAIAINCTNLRSKMESEGVIEKVLDAVAGALKEAAS